MLGGGLVTSSSNRGLIRLHGFADTAAEIMFSARCEAAGGNLLNFELIFSVLVNDVQRLTQVHFLCHLLLCVLLKRLKLLPFCLVDGRIIEGGT
jgi:hypothetical protein